MAQLVRTRKFLVAESPLVWPVAVTGWFPGRADLGTVNVAENVPVDEVVALATWVALKSTTTVSLAPNPVPFTVTVEVGGPTLGFRVMLVVAAATD